MKFPKKGWPKKLLPTEWKALRREIFEVRGAYCEECGSTDWLELDHIVPRSQGGDHSLENLKILCKVCHGAKHGIKVIRGEEKW